MFDLISRLVHRVIVRGHAVKDIFILVPVQWSVVGRQRDMEEKVSTVSHGLYFSNTNQKYLISIIIKTLFSLYLYNFCTKFSLYFHFCTTFSLKIVSKSKNFDELALLNTFP